MDAVLCIGSNTLPLGEFIEALNTVATLGEACAMSGIHSSADVTGKSALPYRNAVMLLRTQSDMPQLREDLNAIESAWGRTARSKESGRMPLDIDIVICDGVTISPSDYSQEYFQVCLRDIEG